MMDDVERIAKGLTEAQRRCLAHEDNEVELCNFDGDHIRHFEAAGLLEGYCFRSWRDYTPLGLAVRTHLQENDNAG